jgi:predicted P-loop ATPase
VTLFKDQEIKEPNFNAIPQELKNHPKWMVWKTEPKKNKPDELGKVPYNLKGYRASKSDPKNWLTFEQAKTAYESGKFDGIGVVINRNDSLVCIDIDDLEDISKVPDFINQSYTELSPSEKGLHLWVRGQKPEWVGTKQNGLEMYGNEKESFLTITGNIHINKPVMANQSLIMSIADKYFSNQKPQEEQPKQKKKVIKFKQVSDDVVINKMFDSKKGDEIKALFSGDWTGYESQSQADQALCNHLAYWTNNDSEQMDRLFRHSSLYRKKWDEKRGNKLYSEMTIQKATEGNQSSFGAFTKVNDDESNFEPENETTRGGEQADDWESLLEYGVNKNGDEYLKKNGRNVELILKNAMGEALAYNEFQQTEVIKDELPWRKQVDPKKNYEPWLNSDDSRLEHYFNTQWDINGKNMIQNAFVEVTHQNSFHPVKEYLEGLEWDGVKRLETMFPDYLGADDSEYTREITRKWMMAAIRRIYNPGIKFDHVPVLSGVERSGKSFVASKLGGEWFTQSLKKLDPKESGEILLKNWIVEIGELSALKKSSTEEIKDFISRTSDDFRPSYGRVVVNHPRHCVFIGTTNNPEYLRDDNGDRRFWSIPVDPKKRKYNPFKELTDDVVNQIWAEAMICADSDEEIYLSEEMEEIALKMRENHRELDPWTGQIEMFVEKQETVCIQELWINAFHKSLEELTKKERNRLAKILRSLGWEMQPKAQRIPNVGITKVFKRVE